MKLSTILLVCLGLAPVTVSAQDEETVARFLISRLAALGKVNPSEQCTAVSKVEATLWLYDDLRAKKPELDPLSGYRGVFEQVRARCASVVAACPATGPIITKPLVPPKGGGGGVTGSVPALILSTMYMTNDVRSKFLSSLDADTRNAVQAWLTAEAGRAVQIQAAVDREVIPLRVDTVELQVKEALETVPNWRSLSADQLADKVGKVAIVSSQNPR